MYAASQCRTTKKNSFSTVFEIGIFLKTKKESLMLDRGETSFIRIGVCFFFPKKEKESHQRNKKKQKKTNVFFLRFFFLLFFLLTDLSAVGLPAKLKHITQRRKRKQP